MENINSPKKTSWLKVALINVVIIVFLLEISLWMLGIPEHYRPHTYPPQFERVDDQEVLYTNKPSASIDFVYDGNPRGYFKWDNAVNQTTNSLGFRGAEFSKDKPADVFRVAFLGDSFTFGEGVYDSDTFPEKFSEIAKRENLAEGKKIEAMNFGAGGYNTAQELAVLKNIADAYHPDVAVLGYTLNDAEPYLFSPSGDSMTRRNREAEIPENYALAQDQPIPAGISRIYDIIWGHFQAEKMEKRTVDCYNSLYEDSKTDWSNTKKALSRIGEYGREKNIPVVAVIFPLFHNLDNNYPFERVHEKIWSELEKDGIEYVDLTDKLRGYKDSELWVHPTDQHPNEKVHAIAAETLVEIFKNEIFSQNNENN